MPLFGSHMILNTSLSQVQLVLELLPGNDLFSRILDRLESGRVCPYDEEEARIITKRHMCCLVVTSMVITRRQGCHSCATLALQRHHPP